MAMVKTNHNGAGRRTSKPVRLKVKKKKVKA